MNHKTGLDYFPFNVDFFQDEKIQFVSARFGTKGEAITIRLLCKIYRNGYFIAWNEDIALLFAKSVGDNCQHSCVIDVVSELIKRGFFDKGIFDRFSILTSRGIQKRYFEASIRRKEVEYNPDFILIDLSEYKNVIALNQNVNISSKNVDILKQSKVKKTKVNESKVIYFDQFWQVYPRKASKAQAEKAFEKLEPDQKLLDEIIAGVERAKLYDDRFLGDPKYTPHPATWLNARGWEDDLSQTPKNSGGDELNVGLEF